MILDLFKYKVWFIMHSRHVSSFSVFAAGWKLRGCCRAGNTWDGFGTRRKLGGTVALAYLPEFWETSLVKQY